VFVLSKEADKAEYIAHMGETCKRGRYEVTIAYRMVHTRSGSYERGFKFHETKYGILTRIGSKKDYCRTMYSFDHGKTWGAWESAAVKSAGRSKVMLERNTTKEFAYDSIQRINRKYGM